MANIQDREPDERLLLARLILDDGEDRAVVLAMLQRNHFTLRYADWLPIVKDLHATGDPINHAALIAHLTAVGIGEPLEEVRLCFAEVADEHESFESLLAIAQRVIRNSQRAWLLNTLQSALLNQHKGDITSFEKDLDKARWLNRKVHQEDPSTSTPNKTNFVHRHAARRRHLTTQERLAA